MTFRCLDDCPKICEAQSVLVFFIKVVFFVQQTKNEKSTDCMNEMNEMNEMNDAKCLKKKEKKSNSIQNGFVPEWCDAVSTDAARSLGARTSDPKTI